MLFVAHLKKEIKTLKKQVNGNTRKETQLFTG